ncbi:hypothetical protein N0V94_004997 [Neodidymelliopsis sp. IMI 364377]|nr:hypothetical protein N0V94_004997 [Neodidymelliopsis sp. IMI 364377]
MDRQEQRKRAFSQAFQRLNQTRLDDSSVQAAKRVLSYSNGFTVPFNHDADQENQTPTDVNSDIAFDQIPSTVLHHPPPSDLQYLNPRLYNYASLQYELYGNGPGPELKDVANAPSPPAPRKREFDGPVLREADLPTPLFVRGQSMFGPSPYVRPDSASRLDDIPRFHVQSENGPSTYQNTSSPMSDVSTTVGPVTPSALNFGDLSLESQGYSLPSSPLRDIGYGNRATVKIMPTSAFASLFPDIKPNEVIILFDRGKEARIVDKYPLSGASRFFAKLLNGPFLNPSYTRCVRLRNDFPYAITSMLHFIETGSYVCDPQAFARYPLLTTLDFHVHAYLVASKYDIAELQDHAIDAYLSIAGHELEQGFMTLSSRQASTVHFPVPDFPIMLHTDGHTDEEPPPTPIDRFLNSLVLLWKNTSTRYDKMRIAVLEVIKRDLNNLLQVPFFLTLMTETVSFGDDVVSSLNEDGFEVHAFQGRISRLQNCGIWFGV